MAGHSKWSKVKRIKVVVDAKRGKIFSKLACKAGAEGFKIDEQGFEILTEPAMLEAVHQKMERAGIKAEAAEITSLPTVTVPLAADGKLIDALEEHDDVKEVYSNAEFPEVA
jgi:transcriptional/translational regulatory protein YebC/TACO1